jgi:hypothetical protein
MIKLGIPYIVIFTRVAHQPSHSNIMPLYQQRLDTPTLTVQTLICVYSSMISVTENDSRNEILKLRHQLVNYCVFVLLRSADLCCAKDTCPGISQHLKLLSAFRRL